MVFENHSSEKSGATALARNDGTFTGTSRQDNWLHEVAARFRSAITLQIPVGYQDATGFNYGWQRELESHPPTDES